MKSFIKTTALTFLMPVLILGGCSHTIPATRAPQPPPQLGKTPPTIAPLSASGKQAQAPESMLPVTLTTDLTPVQRTRPCPSGLLMKVTRSRTTTGGGLSERVSHKYTSRMDW